MDLPGSKSITNRALLLADKVQFFMAGSVLGSLSLPSFLQLGGVDPILAADYLGPWGGLAATLLSIAAGAAM